MLDLHRVASFVAVAEAGGFTAAASTLRQTKAVVSFNVRRLEDDLGVALLARSTRHTSLTQAGERFLGQARALLAQAQALLEDTRGQDDALTGSLRVTSTADFGDHAVIPAIAEFSRRHPLLQIDHAASSRSQDLISERFDVAIRLGTLPDSDHRAARLGDYAIYPVATANYLAARPVARLADLAAADWLGHSRLARGGGWSVRTANGRKRQLDIRTPPRLRADSAQALLQLVLNDVGVAVLPEWVATPLIASGRLQQVLPEVLFPRQDIHGLYRNTPHVPRAVSAFIELLRERRERGLW